MGMKIVVLDGYGMNPGDLCWDALGALGELTVYDRTRPEEVASRIAGAPIVYTNKVVLDRKTIEAAQELRFIGVLATGVNVVDVEAAREQGIPVCNVPAYSTDSVAQMTIALLLEMCLHVGEHSRLVREGEWTKSPDFCFWRYPLVELAGKTMGIIGLGSIGRAVAKIASALGMRVIAYRGHGEGVEMLPLKEVLAQADVLSLHCPLTKENARMIDEAALAQMKPGAFLLNTARGGLLDEAAVAAALKSGRLAGAAVDVASSEPIAADNPLLTAPNCILTPHIAWATSAARVRLMDIAVENLRAFLAGKPINAVNL